MDIQNRANRASKLRHDENYIPQKSCLEVLLTFPPILKDQSCTCAAIGPHDIILILVWSSYLYDIPFCAKFLAGLEN